MAGARWKIARGKSGESEGASQERMGRGKGWQMGQNVFGDFRWGI